jgi:plastocyanin
VPQSDRVASLALVAGHAWTVQAGASTLDEAFQDLDFYTNAITIDAGDTITWRIASVEPHTVSLLAPGQLPPAPDSLQAVTPAGGHSYDGTAFVNSGLLNDQQTFTVAFPKAGTYKYYCLLHQPAMEGTIVVARAGTPYPHTQAFYTHAGQVDEWVDLNAGPPSVALFPFKPGGTTLAAGIAPGLAVAKPSQSTVLRFIDTNKASAITPNITISAGTTLKWVNESNNEPHTITFPPAGQKLPPTLSPFSPPSGGSTFDGTTLRNSGIVPPGKSYSLTFTKRGAYLYYCLFHAREGMFGRVLVI